MPRGDGTGPRGWGPMTGRAAGYCAGSPVPGFADPGPRMGYGPGRGFRRGFGPGMGMGHRARWAYPGGEAPAAEAGYLRERLEVVEARLKELSDQVELDKRLAGGDRAEDTRTEGGQAEDVRGGDCRTGDDDDEE